MCLKTGFHSDHCLTGRPPPTNLMCISVGKQGLGADRRTETETLVKTSNIHASSIKTLNPRGKDPKIQQWMIWTELCKWPQLKFKSIVFVCPDGK